MCSYIPWETNNLLILSLNTSECSYLSLRMSFFCGKQQRDRDEKEWDHSPTTEQETETYLFCRSGSEPVLPSISDSSLSHSLCVFYHCNVSFSQMAIRQKRSYWSQKQVLQIRNFIKPFFIYR